MNKVDIFSPFIYQGYVNETQFIQDSYLPLIYQNYTSNPSHSSDWDVHTDYHSKSTLLNQIDWWTSVQHYKKYVNQFIEDYFRQSLDWRITDNPWYTVYGLGQKSEQHEHMSSDFSAVHFLKFNPKFHEPIRFVHPEFTKTKYITDFKPRIVGNLGTCAKQSYYKEHFVPEIVEGSFIIFPSELQHMVWGNQSNELRVTIAFNFNLMN